MIKIESISKRFDDQLALDCVSLDIKKGEIFGLLGPNGAGKSTLVNIICGILSADKGQVTIDGFPVATSPIEAKARVGMVPQDIALFDNLTVDQNLKIFGALYGLKGKALKLAMDEALAFSALHEKRHKKIKTLSGGMKRRLNLVCAVMHKPEILILDEPTVGVDPQSRNHIMEGVMQLNQERQMTIVYITHYMEEVERLCQRIAIVDYGKVVIEGTKRFIVESIASHKLVNVECEALSEKAIEVIKNAPYTREFIISASGFQLKTPHTFDFHALVSDLNALQISLHAVSIVPPSLESAFLALTGRALREA